MKKIRAALFPGTFDPMTNAHLELVERAQLLFGRVIVAIAESPNKKTMFTLRERIYMARSSLKQLDGVDVIGFNQLLANFAQSCSSTVLIRGLRSGSDFDYERQLAAINSDLNADLETVFLMPSLKNSAISSTIVREVALHQGDVTAFVPASVGQALKEKIAR